MANNCITSLIILLTLLKIGEISCARTQIDLRLGKGDFFLGERHLITLTDVIYYVGGICVGFVLAVIYVLVMDYRFVTVTKKKGISGLKPLLKDPVEVPTKENTNEIANIIANSTESVPRDRDGKLIGPKKYPTNIEERVLKAVHTEPDNYIRVIPRGSGRRGRLLGLNGVSTFFRESQVIRRVDEVDNSFENRQTD